MYNDVNVVLSEVSQNIAEEEEELHGAIVSAGTLRSTLHCLEQPTHCHCILQSKAKYRHVEER